MPSSHTTVDYSIKEGVCSWPNALLAAIMSLGEDTIRPIKPVGNVRPSTDITPRANIPASNYALQILFETR